MKKYWTARAIALAVMTALALCLAGCSGGTGATGPSNGGNAHLVFSASVPSNGNATVDSTTLYEPNADSSGNDRLTISATVSAVNHSFIFYFTPATGATRSAQHVWGPSGGIAQCVTAACSAANVVVSVGARRATFTNLVLAEDPVNGTARSTVNGTITW